MDILDRLKRMTRCFFYLCIGALIKTIQEKVIDFLPMKPLTRAVFTVLQAVVLFAFCLDVLKLVFESDDDDEDDSSGASQTNDRLSVEEPQELLNHRISGHSLTD